MSEESKWFQHVELNVVEQEVPREMLYEVLSEQGAWEQRERKLNMVVVFWLVVAMSLYPSLSQPDVLERISQGVRYVWPEEEVEVASKGAISQRRCWKSFLAAAVQWRLSRVKARGTLACQ